MRTESSPVLLSCVWSFAQAHHERCAGSVNLVTDQGRPPRWLDEPAGSVLQDLQGARPIGGLTIVATRSVADLNGLSLGIFESSGSEPALPQLVDELLVDDLDPDQDTPPGGGNWVPRSLAGPALLVRVAEILQEDLAETQEGWGQARPPWPHHPHPARPVLRDGEAWWICELLDERLYRIGQGAVPTRLRPPPTWSAQSRRSRKRRHIL